MLFAIVDIETTGGSPQRDRIIEIAVAVHDGDRVVRTFESLINPDVAIPSMITQLTGIRNDMVRDAPRFHEIAKDLVEVTEGCVFVAHNVRFDYGFICEAFNRLGYRYIRKLLCTCRLSRQLMAHLPRHNLDTLIQALRIDVPPDKRHRAMGDVMATVEVFEELLRRDTDQKVFDFHLNQGVRESSLPPGITLELLHSLPESCGIYYFHNEAGHVTYVGKSINIKKRVMQHFADRSPKELQLQQSVRDLTFEETGSELVALLLESQEIKRLQPVYNKAQRRKRQPYGIFLTENAEGYHALLADANAQHKKLKPLRCFESILDARNALGGLLDKFQLCQKLIHVEAKQGQCLYRRIGRCLGACEGVESPEDYNRRVAEATLHLAKDFPGDMLVIDEGRTDGEKAFVLVEQGQFQGHGFYDNDEQLSVGDLRAALVKGEHHSDLAAILLAFLRKSRKVKVIDLVESNDF